MKVEFIHVQDNTTKQQKLAKLIHDSFSEQRRIVVFVPSIDAAKFIDQLLWRTPNESFTPHIVSDFPTKERVAITTALTNVNKANIAVNLTSNPLPHIDGIETLYELFDTTSPEKEATSRAKQTAYAR